MSVETIKNDENDVLNCQFCGGKPFINVIDEVFKCYECPKCHRRSRFFEDYDGNNEYVLKNLKKDWNFRNNGRKIKN